ncbi:hypothetical protein H2204_003528 [Knufia peltigerae]|uniref:SnoaL-like domain-containing protein n=1 Tax=Knufia peltigerae TaxID=1002370 RepID=A0AA38Y8Z3_9EURO|nr:hypothetical protein H2204_003528 [Knufia peltigerae]
MVEADLNDPESLDLAFKGATVIYGVTDFWRPLSDPELTKNVKPGQCLSKWAYEYELQQGKNIFDAAAKVSGLERLIFSTIADVAEHSEGKYTRAYHADSKAHAEQYGRRKYPQLWNKTNTIQIGVYLSNFAELSTEMPKKQADGSFSFINQFTAETSLPFIAADEDTGPLVKSLLGEPAGTKLMGYRAWMTFGDFVKTWSRVLDVQAQVVTLPIEEILKGTPGDLEPDVREMLAQGMANMTEFGYKLREDPELMQPSATSLTTVKDLHDKLEMPPSKFHDSVLATEEQEILEHYKEWIRFNHTDFGNKERAKSFYDIPETRFFDLMKQIPRRGFGPHYDSIDVYYDDSHLAIKDMEITAVSKDFGYVTTIQRYWGTGTDGKEFSFTFRMTSLLRKIDGQWKWIHEHVSFPVDLENGKGDLTCGTGTAGKPDMQ